MSYEPHLRPIEEALTAAGRPEDVPAGLGDVARAAALGAAAADVVRIDSRPRRRLLRIVLAAAVITVSTATALAIGVGGGGTAIEHTVRLNGGNGASATVEIGAADGPVRDVSVRVKGLSPAPDGSYYEIWMSRSGESMALAAFNTAADGSVLARTTMPAGVEWDRCFITLEGPGGEPGTPVLEGT